MAISIYLYWNNKLRYHNNLEAYIHIILYIYHKIIYINIWYKIYVYRKNTRISKKDTKEGKRNEVVTSYTNSIWNWYVCYYLYYQRIWTRKAGILVFPIVNITVKEVQGSFERKKHDSQAVSPSRCLKDGIWG